MSNDLVPVEGGAGAVYAEIAEIDHVMKTDRRRYDKDDAMRARYRELLEKQSGEPPAADADLAPAPAAHVRNDLMASHVGLGLIAQWDRGGFDGMVQRMQDAARNIVSGISNRNDLLASFDALPAGARAAVYAELAAGPRMAVSPVSEAGVANFSRTEEGAALAKEWGHNSPKKIASIRAKMWAVIDRLTDDEADSFLDWFDRVPSNEMKIILRQLAA